MEEIKKKIFVRDLPIRLGQFLKLANLVQDGFEARTKIQEGEVQINGIIEKRRGKKLSARDTVTIGGETLIIAEDEDRGKPEELFPGFPD